MREILMLLFVIAVIAIIVYLRRQSAQAAEQRKVDEFRRMQAKVDAESRVASGTAAAGGMLQQAADRAAGSEYAKAADAMAAQTAELERTRQEADRAAARLANSADQALASIQAAAAAHGGAVPGDGTRDCPPEYPIKGNMPSNLYHEPGQLAYNRTIPEVCFQNAASAEAAGFAAASARPAQ